MNIENDDYVMLNIKESVYFYLLNDLELRNKIFDNRYINNIKKEVLKLFIVYLEVNYNKNKRIVDLNKFKDDFIYYVINEENILLNLIENVIY